jgi:ketosteroid isomerase-like protein
MTRDEAQRWLDRYVTAWLAYDAAAIGELFTTDAEYRYHPWDEPVVGRDEIVKGWLNPAGDAAKRDKPGTVEARYACYSADGDRAVAVGDTVYRDAPGGPVTRRYENVWLMEFAADGRCRSFIEYYMQHKR